MIVKTISYSKTFPLAQYVNEKIGIELELTPDDDIESAFHFAKSTVDKWAAEKEPYWRKEDFAFVKTDDLLTVPKEVQIEKPTEEEILSTEQQILSCKELKVLESYKLIVKKNPGLQLAYSTRYEQLHQIETQKQTV